MDASKQRKEIKLCEGVFIVFIFIEGGTFFMGSEDSDSYFDEGPIRKVVLDSFWLGETPVTQAQWEAIMGSNPSFFRGPDRPVEQVSWNDTQSYIKKLNEKTGQTFGLPSEAQWEFAARGGVFNSPYKYAGSDNLKEIGWCTINSHGETKPVKLKFPNELGLYDITGNVWEWCQDWFATDHYRDSKQNEPLFNPLGPDKGDQRVDRGGGWFSTLRDSRLTDRGKFNPKKGLNNLGFRLSLPLKPNSSS